jgi:mono/diheme cytochrome c family protein
MAFLLTLQTDKSVVPIKPALPLGVFERDQTSGYGFLVCSFSRAGSENITSGSKMRAKRILLPALIALSIPAGCGKAQEIGQPGHGLALAERLCAQCHAVKKQEKASPNQDAPPFGEIASTGGMTEIALSAALQTSHASMPNIMLEADERADIIAYIISLK